MQSFKEFIDMLDSSKSGSGELQEGIASEIKRVGRSVISSVSNAKKWHELMRAKYGNEQWDTYWRNHRAKGRLDYLDKILDTGFSENR